MLDAGMKNLDSINFQSRWDRSGVTDPLGKLSSVKTRTYRNVTSTANSFTQQRQLPKELTA
jgi:hypothetical protein